MVKPAGVVAELGLVQDVGLALIRCVGDPYRPDAKCRVGLGRKVDEVVEERLVEFFG